jgi:spore germination protein YaaH
MKKRVLSLLLSGLLIGNLALSNVAHSEDRQLRKIFSGWMTDYSTYGDTTKGQIQAMDFVIAHSEMFDQILPFWYTLTSASNIKDKYVTQNSIDKAIPIATLHGLGIKVIPTITDGTGEGALSKIMANDVSRATLIKTISDLVVANNYDGIDLDFEGFAFVDKLATWPTIQPRWVRFISELSISLHSLNKLLSVTTPYLLDPVTGKKGYYFYAWPEIGSYIDRLNIMAYDYHKYDTAPGPIGPIDWFEPSLVYALKSVAAGKIYIGTPNYGYNWVKKVTGICPTNTPASEKKSSNAAIIHQLRAQAILDKPGAVATYNETYGETNILYTAEFNGFNGAGAPTSCQVNHSVWYVDAQGYGARAKLVEKYQLGGISEWEIGFGDNFAIEEVKKVAIAMGQAKVIGELMPNTGSVNYGEPVTFAGRFTLSDGTALAAVPVFAELKRATGNVRQPIGLTDTAGNFQIAIVLGEPTVISFSTDETWDRAQGITSVNTVEISRVLSWQIPASMRRGVSYKVVGEVQPRVAGVTVFLEEGSEGSGEIFPSKPSSVTDQDGKFEIEITPKKFGVKQFRVVLEAESGFTGTKSPFTNVLVR